MPVARNSSFASTPCSWMLGISAIFNLRVAFREVTVGQVAQHVVPDAEVRLLEGYLGRPLVVDAAELVTGIARSR